MDTDNPDTPTEPTGPTEGAGPTTDPLLQQAAELEQIGMLPVINGYLQDRAVRLRAQVISLEREVAARDDMLADQHDTIQQLRAELDAHDDTDALEQDRGVDETHDTGTDVP